MEPMERTRQWAIEIYKGDAEKADLFLGRPHPMLDNRRPKDVAVDDSGAERVISLLGRAAYGGGV
ncbi:antitoxin Xre/MbcA/ParS toxin-binding domain-containing protein [Allosphingosinicella vermicomposti]|uniref:antitoxin Xre/MbcA/ParS toxin-binding domain-containing protein n=1 Tax=Allosphingosinicella vermicomposti TaxID=614671 RepID=UPI000D0FDCAD|nr:antitoxin Xre/MbcA/ParS toxin-binding domain-containing protein [Allosphingosinicella vermicomposti]